MFLPAYGDLGKLHVYSRYQSGIRAHDAAVELRVDDAGFGFDQSVLEPEQGGRFVLPRRSALGEASCLPVKSPKSAKSMSPGSAGIAYA